MNSRRLFLRQIAISAPLIMAARALGQDTPAPPQAPVHLTEDDPVATALGYKEDATKVDATKYPQFKAGSFCENCALYTGKAGDAEGPCTVFSNKLVKAQGWCATWAPKPPVAPAPAQ